MAGIGFELNKILARQGYASVLQAYLYAGVIGSGPWLVAIISLAFLGMMMSALHTVSHLSLFFVSISHVYGITLILTSPIQLVLTRYAADQEYADAKENIFPAFLSSLSWVALGFSLLGLVLFLGFVPGSIVFRLAAALLMALTSGIWIASVFLTTIRNFKQTLRAFVMGFLTSLAGAYYGGQWAGIEGSMIGFLIGQSVILLWLCAAIYLEVGSKEFPSVQWWRYFAKFHDLALAGFLYNLGVWADKLLFWWYDPHAEQIAGFLHSSPIYDRVVYFGLITIVPGMAVFLLKLETTFAISHHRFFEHVLKKGTLSQLRRYKESMRQSLKDSFILLFKVQGLITALIILNTNTWLQILNLRSIQASIFQITLIGTFLLVVLMSLIMTLYYLDKRKQILACCGCFAGVNTIVTLITISAGEQWFGAGFTAAVAVSCLLAAHFMNQNLERLEYETFTSQPLYG